MRQEKSSDSSHTRDQKSHDADGMRGTKILTVLAVVSILNAAAFIALTATITSVLLRVDIIESIISKNALNGDENSGFRDRRYLDQTIDGDFRKPHKESLSIIRGERSAPNHACTAGSFGPYRLDPFQEYLEWLHHSGEISKELVSHRISRPAIHLESQDIGIHQTSHENEVLNIWRVAPQVSTMESLLYDERTGKLKVLIPGRYYIYSQVYYSDDHLYTVGHEMRINDNTVMKNVLSMNGANVQTSHGGGMFLLNANDTVYITIPEIKTHLHLEKEGTFFGVMFFDGKERVSKAFLDQLYEHRETGNHNGRRGCDQGVRCQPELQPVVVKRESGKVCRSIDVVQQCPDGCVPGEQHAFVELKLYCLGEDKMETLLSRMTSRRRLEKRLKKTGATIKDMVKVHKTCNPME
ncbi:uncharacterized protein [Ptychodera flava]|uniref:uncharacterized protein n=1 Tax=Ptychodera flava TaxID=63121 RepID=UPI003969F37B